MSKQLVVDNFSNLSVEEQKDILRTLVEIHSRSVVQDTLTGVVSDFSAGARRSTQAIARKPLTEANEEQPQRRASRRRGPGAPRGRRGPRTEREIPDIGKVRTLADVARGLVNTRDKVTINEAIEFVQKHLDVMPVTSKEPSKVEQAVRNAFAPLVARGVIVKDTSDKDGPVTFLKAKEKAGNNHNTQPAPASA